MSGKYRESFIKITNFVRKKEQVIYEHLLFGKNIFLLFKYNHLFSLSIIIKCEFNFRFRKTLSASVMFDPKSDVDRLPIRILGRNSDCSI